MNCCENCFEDHFIKSFVINNGRLGDCCFCGSRDVACVKPNDLMEYFLPLMSSYIPRELVESTSAHYTDEVYRIHDLINAQYGIFSNLAEDKIAELLKQITTDDDGDQKYQFVESLHYDWKVDSSDHSHVELDLAWKELAQELKTVNRFFPERMSDEQLDIIRMLLQYLQVRFDKGHIVYRARNSIQHFRYKPNEMGAPPVEKARNRRANPIGISYLYLASDINTAISEVRPSVNENVTIGRHRLLGEIRLIDLRNISPFQFHEDEDYQDLLKHTLFLRKLGEDLTQPVNPKEAELNYLPTQFLCEFIKSNGWDGVLYKSYLGEGYNIALFQPSITKCTKTECYQIGKHTYEYEKINI